MINKFRGLIENENESYWVYFTLESITNKEFIKNFSEITQCIGKTDVDGVDLYEGDVLLLKGKTYQQKWLIEPIGEYERDGDYFGMVASARGNGINHFIDESLLKGKKIGDIYIDGDNILK